jgi:peptide/nickel transport system permease protein
MGTRLRFVLWRLVQMIPVLLGVTFVVFFLIHLVPGDPAETMLGIHATPQRIEALHREWGLDRPLLAQYLLFLSRLLQGNLGTSLFYQQPVVDLVASRLPATLWLLTYAAALSVAIAFPLAVIAASKKDALRDHAVRAIPLVGLGMPPFWVGITLILLLGLRLRLFPVGGYGTGTAGHLKSMFLPALTVAISIAPILLRSLRASMLNVLESEYVVTARSKGIPERLVFTRHVLRNAAIPTVTLLGVNMAFLIGGTVVIENVFALPGVGNLMLQAIQYRDFPVVQGVTLVFGIMVVLVSLLTDLAYMALDPRVKFD